MAGSVKFKVSQIKKKYASNANSPSRNTEVGGAAAEDSVFEDSIVQKPKQVI